MGGRNTNKSGNAGSKSSNTKSPSDSLKARKSYPKTDVRYWRSRVFKPVSSRGSTKISSEHFAVKIQHLGKRKALSLATANREEAAQRARAMWTDLVSGGWEQLLAKHRLRPAKEPMESEKKDGLTLGQYVELVRSKNLIPPATLKGYLTRGLP